MFKTVFYGGSHYVLPILQVLKPVLVVTTEKYPTDPVIKYCLDTNTPYLSVHNLKNPETRKKIEDNITEVAVLANFGLLVPPEILNLYPKGIVNIHPSLLPKFRGPTPGPSTILNNEKEMGVSLIVLDNEVDHGPIIAQTTKSLPDNYTAEDLYLDLFTEGAKLLEDNLEKYVAGEILPSEQKHENATFSPKMTRQSGYFDINNPPSHKEIQQKIRAYHPWPGTWTRLRLRYGGQAKIIKFLPGNRLQVEGGKAMSIKDFLNGYPELELTLRKILSF